MLDAIVSNKTFRNATSVPNCLLLIANFRARNSVLSFKFLKANGCSLQGNIFDSQGSPAELRIFCDAFRMRIGYTPNTGPSFCFARYKLYLDALAGRAPVVSWKDTSALFLRRSLPKIGASPDKSGAKKARWGVVQLVGHLTVNEDGEGSNPSAPANLFSIKGSDGLC